MNPEIGNGIDDSRMFLHRASWVLFSPFSFSGSVGEIRKDGCVVTEGTQIIATGSYVELKEKFPDAMINDHGDTVLLPALVNAHTHLELSCFESLGKSTEKFHCFTDWVKELLRQRHSGYSEKYVNDVAVRTLKKMSGRGVGLVADISNDAEKNYGSVDVSRQTLILPFLELSGFTSDTEQNMLEKIHSFSGTESFFVAAHAPYSTSPKLIRGIKQFVSRYGDIFSIHVAETTDEILFLKDGKGCYRDFLEERGVWDGLFVPPGFGAVSYLDSLGVLDKNTLCVHAVHITEEEIDLLAERQAKICLCPGSNRHLSSGRAPVGIMLDKRILPALGTDSLASNSTLDIWREMQILREDHPDIDPAVVFSMATRGGAESLGRVEFGELLPGRKAVMITVVLDEQCSSPETIYEYLTTAGSSIDVQWAY